MSMAVVKCRCFRYPLMLLVCVLEFFCLVVGGHLGKWKKFLLLLSLILICAIIFMWTWMSNTSIHMKGHYSRWVPSSPTPGKHRTSKYFVQGAYDEIFMYSAIASDHHLHRNDLNVVITSLDKTYNKFQCCFLLDSKLLYITPAQEYFSSYSNANGFWAKFTKHYDRGRYRAHQHSCFLPNTGHNASSVMLTSTQCSSDIADYVSITYPPKVIGGIALCAKIAHSGGIDPEKFVEWVEIQRILGVDKILMFDLGNPPLLTKVFRYYQDLGVLDVLPYELPGLPRRRTLQEQDKRTIQFRHDEMLAVLDCQQRIGGYTYILSHDVDEFLIPREDIDLKTFLKEKMETFLDAAGFMFHTEFFIYDWKPSHPKEDLMVTRYRKTTFPLWECNKYVFLPSRVLATETHTIYPHKPFMKYDVPHEEAVLHHYRQCPADVWKSCNPPTTMDHTMTRFTLKHDLYQRVKNVREATNIHPQWVIG